MDATNALPVGEAMRSGQVRAPRRRYARPAPRLVRREYFTVVILSPNNDAMCGGTVVEMASALSPPEGMPVNAYAARTPAAMVIYGARVAGAVRR